MSARAPRQASPQPPRKWTRTDVNFWLDSSLLLVFLGLVWVATIVEFIFPPATAAADWILWGGTLDQWLDAQFALVAALTLGVLLHLMLHWNWVCAVFFGRVWRSSRRSDLPNEGARTIYGVGLMIVLLNILGLAIAAAALSIQGPL